MALVDTIFPYLENTSGYTRMLCADHIYLFTLTISTETQRANLNVLEFKEQNDGVR